MPEEPCPEQKDGAGNQKAPRTLDERRAEDQDIPESEEPDSNHVPLWFEQKVSRARLVRHEETVGTEQAERSTLASRPARGDLPYEGLMTVGELLLCMFVFSTILWLTWWAFGYLGDLLYPVEILADYRLLISFIISGVMAALIWLTNRAKRLNRAKHLRGELKT